MIEAGQDIVSVHLAGGISGTCEAARQARGLLEEQGLGDRITVVDGETACGGLGLLLLAGSAAARAGADQDAVVARVPQTRSSLKLWFCLDTLEYLRRGGRIGKAQAWLGGTLKIKPILSMGYEITPVERVRTAGRAFERMVAVHARSCTTPAPTAGWCSTSRRPTRPSGWSSAGGRSSAPSQCSSRKSAR